MVTYSVAATMFRSTTFGREEFRKLALTSGDATKEFGATVDLTVNPLPTFPILILSPNITTAKFVFLQVTGGSATIRFTRASGVYNNIDLVVDQGSLIMSGVDITQITVLGTPSGSCYIECFGMGN